MKIKENSWDDFWGKRWLIAWKSSRLGTTPTVRNVFRVFKSLELPKSSDILDVGCGSATLANFWLQQGYTNITGYDISEEALKIARGKGLCCVKGDISQGLPFKNNAFDLVYSDGLIEHFIHPKLILQESFRVSKGYVLTIVPRDTILNTILTSISKPPKEYRRDDSEWVEIHKAFRPADISWQKSLFVSLIILCKVGEEA